MFKHRNVLLVDSKLISNVLSWSFFLSRVFLQDHGNEVIISNRCYAITMHAKLIPISIANYQLGCFVLLFTVGAIFLSISFITPLYFCFLIEMDNSYIAYILWLSKVFLKLLYVGISLLKWPCQDLSICYIYIYLSAEMYSQELAQHWAFSWISYSTL